MDDYSNDNDEARKEYVWRRKCEIYQDIEELWQSYLKELDYPRVDFVGYVARHNNVPLHRTEAHYLIWVWKFVRSFMPMILN